jgi:hypothetical protein
MDSRPAIPIGLESIRVIQSGQELGYGPIELLISVTECGAEMNQSKIL